MRHQIFWEPAVVLATVLVGVPPGAFGQAGQAEVGEVGAFVGGTFGAGSHGAVGASAGVAVSHHGSLMFETSFMPLGNHTIQSWPAASTVQRSHLWDFALDAHIRIPVKDRWEPYAIIGSGLLWNTVRAQIVNADGVAEIHGYDQFKGVFHTGGGVRYFIGRSWGIRPEVKAIVSKHTYTRVSVGIFYVTPTEWP